jgi:hypothetical protein
MKLIVFAGLATLIAGAAGNALAYEDQTELVYSFSLQGDDAVYMTLNEFNVIEGSAPDYRRGGSWYFQLIDEQQRVLEEGHFDYSDILCSDYVDESGQWRGECKKQYNAVLSLAIRYHQNGADITVYDNNGIVRFGPYDVRGL